MAEADRGVSSVLNPWLLRPSHCQGTLVVPLAFLLLGVACEIVAAENVVNFDKTVAPLIAGRCLSCHSGGDAKGGLDLSREKKVLAGGDSGAALTPGKLGDSLLWQRISKDEMPPKRPLSDSEKNLLKAWIISGAKWGTDPIDPYRFTSGTRAGADWWSREPGCFQLKSALAWSDLGFDDWYERALEFSLRTHDTFLPGESDPLRVMDRLHAYSYFLEALCKHRTRPECEAALRTGIPKVAHLLREIGQRFERSDVCAQLLRVRLLASDVVDLDVADAEYEAAHCASHQRFGGPAIEDGGFGFGTRDGVALPYMNPVSTAFCMQACAWWSDWRNGAFRGTIAELI